MAACPLAERVTNGVWLEKAQYQDAEKKYFEHLSKVSSHMSDIKMYTYVHLCNYYFTAVLMCSYFIYTQIRVTL